MSGRGRVGTLVVGLFLLGLSACSKSGPSSEVPTDRLSPAPAAVSAELDEVPELTDAVGAIGDAVFGDCSTEAGTQEVTGSVTNGSEETKDLTVTVNWVNERSTVLVRTVTVLEAVDAGESRDVTLSAEVPDGATQCTFRVLRGALAAS